MIGLYYFFVAFMDFETSLWAMNPFFLFLLAKVLMGLGFCIALVENGLWVSLPKIV